MKWSVFFWSSISTEAALHTAHQTNTVQSKSGTSQSADDSMSESWASLLIAGTFVVFLAL